MYSFIHSPPKVISCTTIDIAKHWPSSTFYTWILRWTQVSYASPGFLEATCLLDPQLSSSAVTACAHRAPLPETNMSLADGILAPTRLWTPESSIADQPTAEQFWLFSSLPDWTKRHTHGMGSDGEQLSKLPHDQPQKCREVIPHRKFWPKSPLCFCSHKQIEARCLFKAPPWHLSYAKNPKPKTPSPSRCPALLLHGPRERGPHLSSCHRIPCVTSVFAPSLSARSAISQALALQLLPQDLCSRKSRWRKMLFL